MVDEKKQKKEKKCEDIVGGRTREKTMLDVEGLERKIWNLRCQLNCTVVIFMAKDNDIELGDKDKKNYRKP